MSDIIELAEAEWHTAEELADRLNVSRRTVFNRLDRGEIEKKQTDAGMRYRVKKVKASGESEVHETEVKPVGEADISQGIRADSGGEGSGESAFHESASSLLDRLESQAERIGRLESENERLREKVNRLEADDTGEAAEDDSPSEAKRLVDALRETADTNA
jgi:excisionase family DNA binding protein